VGTAQGSSMEMVCRDWQPPRTAASAWMADRDTICSLAVAGKRRAGGLCVETPRSSERDPGRGKRSRIIVAHSGARRETWRLLPAGHLWAFEEKGKLRGEFVNCQAGRGEPLRRRRCRRRELEGNFLHGGRAGFANVITGMEDGMSTWEASAWHQPKMSVTDAHGVLGTG